MTRSLEALQRDFLNLKFGMFIHYNMATYKGVQWVDGYPDPCTFDPGGPVDTDAWADAAVAAGMTYAVLTAKHVAGFCLWDSRYTPYSVMHPACPYQEDLVAQFVRSFTRRGLRVGLYYCWRSPGFDDGDNRGKYKVLPPECDPATHSLDEQIDFQKKQIAELIERYPEVSYIWNDGLDPTIMPAEEAQAFIRSLGPDIIASANWWDWGQKGMPYLDLAVTEMRHFGKRDEQQGCPPGETCWCLEHKWFDTGAPPEDAETIVRHIATANARNKNFLLNVGPDKQGRISAESLRVLQEIGMLRQEQHQADRALCPPAV